MKVANNDYLECTPEEYMKWFQQLFTLKGCWGRLGKRVDRVQINRDPRDRRDEHVMKYRKMFILYIVTGDVCSVRNLPVEDMRFKLWCCR